MKNIQELNAIKDKMSGKVPFRDDGLRVVVGLATCGIAAGAGAVMEVLEKAVEGKKLQNVTVSQTGCVGICQYEPVVEVFGPGSQRVTYVKVDAEKAQKIFDEHIAGGRIVEEYTIGTHIK